MGDRQSRRVAGAARRIDESEIRNASGRAQLEDARRYATVDYLLADKGVRGKCCRVSDSLSRPGVRSQANAASSGVVVPALRRKARRRLSRARRPNRVEARPRVKTQSRAQRSLGVAAVQRRHMYNRNAQNPDQLSRAWRMGQIDPEATLLIGPGTDAKRLRAAFPEQLALDLRTVDCCAQFGHDRSTINGLSQ